MPQPTPELIQRVHEWKRKVADGSITLEEMKDAVVYLRGGRAFAQTAAAESASKGGKRAKAPIRSADDMLAELGI